MQPWSHAVQSSCLRKKTQPFETLRQTTHSHHMAAVLECLESAAVEILLQGLARPQTAWLWA